MVRRVAMRGDAGAWADVIVKTVRVAACPVLVHPDLMVPQRPCADHVLGRFAHNLPPFRLGWTNRDPTGGDRRRGREDLVCTVRLEGFLALQGEEWKVERPKTIAIALGGLARWPVTPAKLQVQKRCAEEPARADNVVANVVAKGPPHPYAADLLQEPTTSVPLSDSPAEGSTLAPGAVALPKLDIARRLRTTFPASAGQ